MFSLFPSLRKIFTLNLGLFLGLLISNPTALGQAAVTVSPEVKYIPLREGTPSLRWDSTYSRANCPDDAKMIEGSTDTRGTVQIPNIDLAHTDFTCVIKFSQPFPHPPICAVTGIGFATPVNMTFKVHSVTEEFVEVKGQVNSGSGATLAFNYICM
jgi:hypothetical protein